MRKIKFRGKTKSGWSYYDFRGFGTKNFFVAVNPNTVGQYTGLNDKNGVEIYEGDIIRIRWRDTLTGKLHERAKVVFFKNGTFNINFTTKGERKLAQRQIEVIGNIHDNPELLKENERK